LKRTVLLYLVAAFIIGILVTVIPLVTLAQIKTSSNQAQTAQSLGTGLKQLDGSSNSKTDNSEVFVLAVAFIIALLAYGVGGQHAPRRYEMRLGVPPH
jgi:hypothetical protein